MTTNTQAKPFALGAYVAGIESRDAAGQLAAFTQDATLEVIDHEHPPSNPTRLQGATLRDYVADVCGRDMTHQVRSSTLSSERFAIEVACRYADGTNVLCVAISELSDGRIAAQRIVQAW